MLSPNELGRNRSSHDPHLIIGVPIAAHEEEPTAVYNGLANLSKFALRSNYAPNVSIIPFLNYPKHASDTKIRTSVEAVRAIEEVSASYACLDIAPIISRAEDATIGEIRRILWDRALERYRPVAGGCIALTTDIDVVALYGRDGSFDPLIEKMQSEALPHLFSRYTIGRPDEELEFSGFDINRLIENTGLTEHDIAFMSTALKSLDSSGLFLSGAEASYSFRPECYMPAGGHSSMDANCETLNLRDAIERNTGVDPGGSPTHPLIFEFSSRRHTRKLARDRSMENLWGDGLTQNDSHRDMDVFAKDVIELGKYFKLDPIGAMKQILYTQYAVRENPILLGVADSGDVDSNTEEIYNGVQNKVLGLLGVWITIQYFYGDFKIEDFEPFIESITYSSGKHFERWLSGLSKNTYQMSSREEQYAEVQSSATSFMKTCEDWCTALKPLQDWRSVALVPNTDQLTVLT